MPTTDLKFFTNEPERTLYDRFNKILKTNTQYFDVIVGYFRTSGFFRLCDAMKDLDKIRILVGLNVDKTTVDLIEQSENNTVIMSQKESKQEYGAQIETEFAGKGYGDFKLAVGEAVADHLEPVRNEFARLIQDKAYLKECYTAGAEKALRYSQRTLTKVYRKIGFVDRG